LGVDVPGQESVDLIDRMICNTVEDDSGIFSQVKLLHLCCLFSLRSLRFANNQAVNRCYPITSGIRTGEHPSAASKCGDR